MTAFGKPGNGSPKFGQQIPNNKKYEAFLQNKEFTEYLAKNFDNSMDKIAEAIAQFRTAHPEVRIENHTPEIDLSSLEDGLSVINDNIIKMIEAQGQTNEILAQLLDAINHVAKPNREQYTKKKE